MDEERLDPAERRKLMLLRLTLEAAVPLWAHRLRKLPWRAVEERARACAEVVAEKGDVILYKSKRRGATADAFNHLAEGLACLSFVRGGVRVFGIHFEHEHPEAVESAWLVEWKARFEASLAEGS